MTHVLTKAATVALFGLMPQMAPSQQAEGDSAPIAALDPQAIEIAASAMDYLSAQDRIQVNWFVSYDEVVDGREKLTHIRSGLSLLSRGEGLYSYTENGLKTREFFYDGNQFQIVDVDNNAYVRMPFSGEVGDLATRLRREHDVVLPIWSVLSRESRGDMVDVATAAAYVGLTRIAGQEAHHLAFSSYDEDWQVWVSADEDHPVLMMIVGTDPYVQGWPQYRAYFNDWDFEPDIPEGAFVFEPDESSERMSWPKTGGGGLPPVSDREE